MLVDISEAIVEIQKSRHPENRGGLVGSVYEGVEQQQTAG
jgi:hypothetical protein